VHGPRLTVSAKRLSPRSSWARLSALHRVQSGPPTDAARLTSLLVAVLLARLALGPTLAAVAAARSTATVATVVGPAWLALLFRHDDPFAWM
jgi:hypothetical protein